MSHFYYSSSTLVPKKKAGINVSSEKADTRRALAYTYSGEKRACKVLNILLFSVCRFSVCFFPPLLYELSVFSLHFCPFSGFAFCTCLMCTKRPSRTMYSALNSNYSIVIPCSEIMSFLYLFSESVLLGHRHSLSF